VLGTPQYMSTEQARGRDDVDLRTDVWSAGAILYELVTGSVPFAAGNYNAMLDKIMHEEPALLSSFGILEPGLQSVVSRSLAKERSERFQSARELRTAMEALLPILPTGSEFRFEHSAGRINIKTDVSEHGPLLAEIQHGELDVLMLETMAGPPLVPTPSLTPVEDGDSGASKGPKPEMAPMSRRGRRKAALLVALLGVVGIVVLLERAQPPATESPAQAQTPLGPAAERRAPSAGNEIARMEDPAPNAARDPVSIPSSSPVRDQSPPSPGASLSASAPTPAPVRKGTRTPRTTEAPRSKPVTRVDSAGF
jgi:serine/threonine protein kinase